MDCPKCHQPTSLAPGASRCALCGFDLAPVQRSLGVLYALSSAIFFSVLIYGGLVYYLEQQADFRPTLRTLPLALPYALLAVSVMLFGVAVHVLAKRVATARDMTHLRGLMVMRLALAEGIAIFGLALYLLSHSLEWFVTFLGLSFLAFLMIASQMPTVVRRLGELAVGEDSR